MSSVEARRSRMSRRSGDDMIGLKSMARHRFDSARNSPFEPCELHNISLNSCMQQEYAWCYTRLKMRGILLRGKLKIALG